MKISRRALQLEKISALCRHVNRDFSDQGITAFYGKFLQIEAPKGSSILRDLLNLYVLVFEYSSDTFNPDTLRVRLGARKAIVSYYEKQTGIKKRDLA